MGTYLVTGGAGFIGSHLADALLAAGHAVRILDDFSTGQLANLDGRCEVERDDVCDAAAVRRAMAGVDGCFHLAAVASVARSNEDWAGTHRINLGGTVNVLDAARGCGGTPVVYASSAAIYGRREGVADEGAMPAPMTAYGADKLGSELHARAGRLVHGVPSLGFRFFNVYGPRQDPDSPYSGVISIFAKALAMRRGIRIFGTGEQTRDFIFVGDIIRFLRAGMALLREGTDVPAGLVLNACTGRETSVFQMAQTIGELLGCEPQIDFGPARVGDIVRSVGSPDLASATLAFRAETVLRDGLRQTLASLQGQESLQPAA